MDWTRGSSPHAEWNMSLPQGPQAGRDAHSNPHPSCLPAPSPASSRGRHSWMEKPAVGRQGCRNKGPIAAQTLSNREQSPAALSKRRGREI